MPVVRDGRNRVDEYETVPPAAVPSGPVERRQVSAQRMADFAAERAGAAARRISPSELAFNPTQDQRPIKRFQEVPVPAPAIAATTNREQARRDKAARFLAAIRATPSHGAAAVQLDVAKHTVEQFVSDLRRRGELPLDVEQQLRERNPALYRRAPVPDPTGTNPAFALAGSQRTPPLEGPAGLSTDASQMHETTSDSTLEAPEASVPATDAEGLTANGPAAEQLATPPAPTSPVVALPCGPCVHFAVCSIRPELEAALPTLDVARPHPAISIAIRCDHFLEARP